MGMLRLNPWLLDIVQQQAVDPLGFVIGVLVNTFC